MKTEFINYDEKNSGLIIFFNSWGFDSEVVRHLSCGGYNVCAVSDYRNLDWDFEEINIEKYEKKYLVCWSMGVYVSSVFKRIFDKFDKKIAVNGTPKMIDDEFGIPKRVYSLTLKRFNDESCKKFAQNMFNSFEIPFQPKRSCDELREELQNLNDINVNLEELKFDKAYISTEDKIVPAKNQLNYWLSRTSTELLNTPHYPFSLFNSWSELL